MEVALKMAIQCWQQRGEPQRKGFLAFEKAYHGDTLGAMSLGGRGLFSRPYEGLLFPVWRAKHPASSTTDPKLFAEQALQLLEMHGKELAAMVIEPLVQGAGGMCMWPLEALQSICAKAREQGVLLIFDEVMTGFGRTGTPFAFEQVGYLPDILCLAKGLTAGALPLAATLTNDFVYESFLSPQKEKMFFHGHSFAGNPIACAAALANLQLMEEREHSLQASWKKTEQIHRERLKALTSTASTASATSAASAYFRCFRYFRYFRWFFHHLFHRSHPPPERTYRRSSCLWHFSGLECEHLFYRRLHHFHPRIHLKGFLCFKSFRSPASKSFTGRGFSTSFRKCALPYATLLHRGIPTSQGLG